MAETENVKNVEEETVIEENEKDNLPSPSDTCGVRERLKSKGVWVSVLGAVGLILNSFGVFAKWGIETEEWTLIINTVCGILVTFGILNNPTDCRHF